MKKASKFLSLLILVAMLIGLLPTLNVMAVNPYLPLWEHLPDGEPKVFEDPDNPGKYRAYIFGSHDVNYRDYCGPDVRAWSAPVEDLTDWKDEGSVFKYNIEGQWDIFFAPDIVEVIRKDGTEGGKKEYYLYPHSRGNGRIGMVCKSDSPVGPFEPINMNEAGTRTVSGSVLGFDPAVWIEDITDENDEDYEIGFRAYAYWGFAGSNEKSWACQLDQETMYSVRPGTDSIQYFMPCSSSYGNINDPEGTTYEYIYPDEDINTFNFFEASSIRKIGNKYIMLYSGYSGPDYGLGSTNSALRYCYGDTPLGPWRSGGVLVDSRAPVLNEAGTGLATSNTAHNTHGSLLEINGNWYCFYHRPPRGYNGARQPMVAPVKITWEEESVENGGKVVIRGFDPYSDDQTWTAKASNGDEYTGAEVTSEGFEVFGWDPYKYYSAGYACYLSSTGTLQDSFDIWDNNMPITNVQNGHRIGFKYFGFGGLEAEQASEYGLNAFEGTKPGNNTEFNLFLTPKTTNAFKVNIWMDGPWDNEAWNGTKIGTIEVPANSEQVVDKFSVDVSEFVDNMDEKHAIFLVAEGGSGNLFDLTGLGFSSETKDIEYIAPPQISIFVEGEPVTLPTTPIRGTNANGITGYDQFELSYAYPFYSSKPLNVTADSDYEGMIFDITQPTTPNGVAEVKFNKDGVVKTYKVNLSVNSEILTTAYIDDIKVDDESIPGFKKNGFNYSIEVPAGTTDVPVIEAIKSDDDIVLDVIEEIESIPGVMVIQSTNTDTEASVTYRVGVGYSPVTTDFTDGEPAGWNFKNKNENAVFGENGLTITTEQGAFSNEEAQPQNVFMQPALGDWVAYTEVELEATPTASNQQAGLIVYDDADNYIRFVYERPTSGSSNVLRVYNAVNGVETRSNSATIASLTNIHLQVAKDNNNYTFRYSQDGSAWTTFATSIGASYALPQIGLYATNGNVEEVESISATYENLTIYELANLYPRLATLNVGGKPVPGFKPEVFTYNVEVAADSTEAPVLTATGESDDYEITYGNIDTPTGTATVTVRSPIASATYTLIFNTGPKSDYFADGTMDDNWTILRENAETYSIEKGLGLRLPTQSSDIYSTGAAWVNAFVQPAMGDWEVVTKVFYPHVPTADYQQAMVLVWQDEDNYIRANCQQAALTLEPGKETNGSFSGTNSGNATANADGSVTLYHKIQKIGKSYTISFSQDGLTYRQLIVVEADYNDPKIALFATQNTDNPQMDTYFEYITVTKANGEVQKTYEDMLQDAVNNVNDYIASDIPSRVSDNIDLTSIPHGYTATLESSDPDVIAADGTVTRPAAGNKSVTLTLTVADGEITSVSEPINVTVIGLDGEVEEASVKLAASGTVSPGSSFNVDVSINTNNNAVYAEDIVFKYDANVFEFVKVTAANEGIEIFEENDPDAGVLSVVAANVGGSGITGKDAPIFKLTFKVKSGVSGKSSTISVTKAELGVMPGPIMIEALLDSKTIQVSQGDPGGIDKSALQNAINSAETVYDVAEIGIEDGNYFEFAMDALQAAIDDAKAIFEDSSVGQTDIDNATTALNSAIEAFEDSAITPETGNINGNSRIDVGDLAVVAYYYGTTSTSEDWEAAMKADINGDNKINISDLVFIARRMIIK